ncbi:MAG: hypothetical protein E6K81_14970, partial [Candidatus Eisenbacteria bacterium]
MRSGRQALAGRGEPVLDAAVLNHEQALAWREAARPARRGALGAAPSGRVPGPARANAFDEDFPEVRVRIDTTGVYELAYDDLFNVGYPAGIKIDQVSVHRHEFAEGAIPSYQTVELAIDVDDADHDTFFGSGDRIIVYAQNWAERARASVAQRVWGDAECVFVTAVAGTGRRIPSRPGWRDQTGLTPLASYPWRQHWEKDYVYSGFPADTLTDQLHWTGITGFSPPAESLSFETNHLDVTRPGSFTLSLVGRNPSSHTEWAQIRNGPGALFDVMVGVAWLGLGTLNTTVTLPPGTLSEGNVNHLRLWGQGTTSTYDYVGLDSFEATYWRAYRALFDYLPCNSADGSGEIQIHATGFSDPAMQVYDVSDSLNPVRLTIDPAHVQSQGPFEYSVDFQDLVVPGQTHRYVAFRYPKGLPPEVMTRVNRPQTRLSERGAGDYLMIVPEAFLPAVGPLVTKRQEEGLDVVVAPFETVCDEFNGGRKSSYAIKRFARFAFENWDARWVLLVGDGNLDPLNRTGDSSPDWIPVQRILGPVGIVNGNEAVPSDPWYGCMGACDISGPSPAVPDLYVGRLPVQTLQETQDLVRKLVDYDVVSNDQTWRNQLLLSADDDYSDASLQPGGGGPAICRQSSEQVFRGISETVAATIDSAGLRRTEVDRFYLADLLGRIGCTDPQDRNCTCRDLFTVQGATRGQGGPTDQLVNRLNAGCLWWNFQGHANAGQLTHEEWIVDDDRGDDTQRLINDGKPFLFSAFSCHANAFARPNDVPFGLGPALGEDLVLRPRGGAIASWASSGFEILPGSSTSHINVSLAEAMFSDPPHTASFDGQGARVLLGEAIGLAIARYVPGVAFNQNERGIGLTYQLLGDPATRFSLGPPQAIVTANGDTVINDRPVALAPPRDTLHLEADLASNVRIDAISLESITGTIPPTDYTLTLADTSGGHRYHLSYTTPVRSLRYTIHAQDRYGLKSDFNLLFPFFSQL